MKELIYSKQTEVLLKITFTDKDIECLQSIPSNLDYSGILAHILALINDKIIT